MVLSQACTASSSEQSWARMTNIHTKKCNRLKKDRVDKLVFVGSNLKSLRREQSETSVDVLLSQRRATISVDSDSDWDDVSGNAGAGEDVDPLDDDTESESDDYGQPSEEQGRELQPREASDDEI